MDDTRIDFKTAEMKDVRFNAWMMLMNAEAAGFVLGFAGTAFLFHLREASLKATWISVGFGIYSVGAGLWCARDMLRTLGFVHRSLSIWYIVLLCLLMATVGCTLGYYYVTLRQPTGGTLGVPIDGTGVIGILVLGSLLATAMTPVLLNRWSLR